jgi:hypothetical protein
LIIQEGRETAADDWWLSTLGFVTHVITAAVGLLGRKAVPTAILAIFIGTRVAAQEAPTTQAERVIVSASTLTEETLIGANQQPAWTARRRFSTTRIYVLPPWQVEFEQWWKGKFPRVGKPEHLFQSEIEVGLPYRFQLDLYENVEHTPHAATKTSNQLEARWALADWGRIPLNPTLYAEWKFNGVAPDAYELKLLLGEQLAPCWHWGFNLFYEQETGGARATELGFSQAVSYSAIDSKFSVGVEMNFEHTTQKSSRGNPAIEFLIGPSIQWRPTTRTHLDFVPLFGATRDSPRVEAFLVFGIELGDGAASKEVEAPVSAGAR